MLSDFTELFKRNGDHFYKDNHSPVKTSAFHAPGTRANASTDINYLLRPDITLKYRVLKIIILILLILR